VSAVTSGNNGESYSGGIVGRLDNDSLRNCYNTGALSAAATGTGSTAYTGGVAGSVVTGTTTACYYLNTASQGVGSTEGSCSIDAASKTEEEMKSAAFADNLNSWVDDATNQTNFPDALHWGIVSGKNSGYPVFGAAYTVTFNANGGSVATASGVTGTDGKLSSLPTPTQTSYTFDGWFTAASGGTAISTSTVFTANTTIFAHWTYSGGSYSGGSTPSTGVPVIVDGKTDNIGTENKSGTSTTVTVDQTKLTSKIGSAAKDSSVVVPVGENGSATAAFVVKNVEKMAAKGMTLTVQSGSVAYNLTTGAIDTAALAASFPGADMSKVPFDVTIKNSSVTFEGATLILSPVEFTVTATYGGTTVSVDTFSAFVDRTVEITAEQAAKITTAVVVNTDGSTRHVPTNVIEKDGKYYAVINSRTNSTYALIENKVTFTDAAGKWYEAAVNEMGSRKIISGRESGVFDGGASITRAEFAAILVRALGLPANGTSTFSDVSASGWYSGAVATAAQYGLVTGEGENKFDPAANISRQEAMAMLQRAAKLTTFAGTSGTLDSFTDLDSVGTWANDAAKWNVGSGLIQGADGKLNPNTNITRAESATIILRLLQKAGLVDVRSKV